ncbi:anti-sigma factor [Myxacorys almedinensis]|uniref:Regulator of SigK n=1 Tax=Myxacorys almedinensis A TaxID=2690445 RepID=A0A8J7Z1Q4_9CYAN|nr:anti-sigma factor [Myxacorys almedinensis]NDJ16181.1 anti-sigma factor [Myxacorys almedinensis A]
MAGSMLSEHIELLVSGYVLGDLSAEEAEEFQRLLATDPAIAQEVVRMQNVLEQSFAPAEVTPPTHLRAAILEKHRALAAPNLAPDRSKERPHRRRATWGNLAGLAAAGVILALGINNYQLRQALQPPTQPDEALTYGLKPAIAEVSASATVVVDPNRLEGRITAQNLPPLPPGQVYALWVVLKPNAPFTTDPKSAILMGSFEVEAGRTTTQTITPPSVFRSREWIAAVAVTAENAAAPQEHENQPILISGL